MKTLYLHIGLPKTGTSAIQKFLLTNTDYLASQGYCFKRTPFSYERASQNRNGHFLVERKKDADGTFSQTLTRAHREEGMQLVLNWFQTYDNVILSEENIWIHGKIEPENPLDFIAECSQKYHFTLKIVVYLRRQDDLISSWWKQQVRAGKPVQDWARILRKVPTHYNINYRKMLNVIEKKVGRNALIVRRYDRELFDKNGTTLYSDFLNAIGLEFNEQYVIPETLTNQSFPDSYTEIKRILNGLNTPNSSFSTSDIHYLEEVAIRCSRELPHEKTSLFSAEERIEFLKKYQNNNAAVAKKYFQSDEPLFSETMPDTPKFDRSSYSYQEDIIQFFGAVCLQQEAEISALKEQQQEQISVLRKQIDDLQKQVDANTRKLKPHIPGWWRVRRFFRNLIKK